MTEDASLVITELGASSDPLPADPAGGMTPGEDGYAELVNATIDPSDPASRSSSHSWAADGQA